MADIMKFNPMAYWIEVVRDPLEGAMPDPWTYAVVVGMAIVGLALAAWLTQSKAHRLPYWV
jgi:lipopolysaccharide transport system permease protein